MQDYALTIDKFLRHAAKWSGKRRIVGIAPDGARREMGYAALYERANRLSGAFAALGLGFGDRIATLAWNTPHHLETYYAAMGAGFVCHTLNPRFSAAHLAAIVNEAADRVLAVSADLLPLLRELAPLCPGLEHIVLMDEDAPGVPALEGCAARLWRHEALRAELGAPVEWGGFDENAPAGLCYTSGTTGAPKGVLYTHRSNYLHTLRALQADAMAPTAADAILAAVPMFHANGWGLPFAAPAVGAALVLPGRHLDGASLVRLMREEAVTLAVGVYTVWLGVIEHLEATGGDLPDLARVLIGGSTCPEPVIRRIEERLGVQVQASWGMTELSPLGVIVPPGAPGSANRGSGRPVMGIDLKLTDAQGVELPQQRGGVGHLKVKGHSVVDRYYLAADQALDAEGFFDTGDLASIDADGHLAICGRAKDLIKSGGEWINPVEIEEIVSRHPAVGLAAVVARADAKWGERPVLVIEPRIGREVQPQEVLALLRGKVADWWIPRDVVLLETMPLAATGKIDKLRLRAEYS